MSFPSPEVTKRTLVLERWRAVLMGIYESAPSIFLLLIVVRWFQGSPAEKSVIAAAVNGGLLVAPLVIFMERRCRASAPKAIATLFGIAGVCMAGAAVTSSKLWFIAFASVAIVGQTAVAPLVTSIYSSNIPATVRGRYYAQYSGIRTAASVVFATVAGWALSGQLDQYRWLVGFYAVVLCIAAMLAVRLPAPSAEPTVRPLLACFSYLKTDPILRDTTIAWFLMGFGNLMMLPLRVEYLANDHYGLRLSEVDIALIVSTVPNIARLLGATVWGRAFDTMNFFTLRIVLNIAFALGTLAFFASGSWLSLMLSAIILGFVTAGGDVAWSLWVTKFAPPGRVPDYMAVHVFFTGVRGIIAPTVGFFSLQYVSFQALSWLCAALMAASAVVLMRSRPKPL
jgi:MFS family permease